MSGILDCLAKRRETVSITAYQSELEYCLAQAAEILGGPAEPVWLNWELEGTLVDQAKLEARRGFGRRPPLFHFDSTKRGHELAIGVERYRWPTAEGTLRLAKVVPPCGCRVPDFWAVPRDDFRRFYRLLRRETRARQSAPPVMHEADRKRLWDNTVGFLRCGQEELRRYGVTPKRGLLLLGEPGNGKTMACRWLAGECRRRGLEWKNVTTAMYDEARSAGELSDLFELDSPGIILFDDFDDPLRTRDHSLEVDRHSTFLGELDGMHQKTGVVFLFTSNAKLDELDPAMCRPGRLDVVIHFPRPDALLRRLLVETRWHADLLAGIDLEKVVADTQGYSFAEIEESKKLLVLHHAETRRWDWPWVHQAMQSRRTAQQAKRPIGFGAGMNGKHREPSLAAHCSSLPTPTF